MIKKQTVFILGAGASHPYGYPLGTDLLGEFELLAKNEDFHKYLASPYSKSSIGEFESFLTVLKDSSSPSIDRFLEHRSEFQKIGKHSIAYYFIKKDEHDINKRETYRDNWYSILFHKLMYEQRFSDFLNNKVTFVTFNYDVTLERFFKKSIHSIYGGGSKNDEINIFFNNIKIHHPHGNIRGFSWENPDWDNFDRLEMGYDEIKKNGEKHLKLTDEGWNPAVYWLKGLIPEAQRVIFLGFGFHKSNIDKLQFNWPGGDENRTFESTAKGITSVEETVFKRNLGGCDVNFRRMDSQMYLKERLDFLTD